MRARATRCPTRVRAKRRDAAFTSRDCRRSGKRSTLLTQLSYDCNRRYLRDSARAGGSSRYDREDAHRPRWTALPTTTGRDRFTCARLSLRDLTHAGSEYATRTV